MPFLPRTGWKDSGSRKMSGRAECRDDVRPEQDLSPGRDRQRLRAGGFPAFQCSLLRADPPQSARERSRRLESDGVPIPGGFCLRRHALQLHRDCRQSAHGAGPGRKYGDLETGQHGTVQRAFPDEALPGSRSARRRDQHGAGPRRNRCRSRAREPGSRRRPLHGSTAVFNSFLGMFGLG